MPDLADQQMPSPLPDKGIRSVSRMATRVREGFVHTFLTVCAIFSVTITFAILVVLLQETFYFFQRDEVTLGEFFFSTQWSPLLGSTKKFGIWPLISGTMLVTLIALVVSLPLGLVTAIFLSEYAPAKLRAVLKPFLEILAGIPTVVYGFFALTAITPFLKSISESFNVYNAGSAGIAVGIICLPIVSSLSEDALRAVPQSLRDGAYGLGATKFETSIFVVLPAALSGIVSAVLLVVARAVGETMIVALAAGSTPRMTLDPRSEIQTMTGFMVQMALGDVSNFGTEYLSMYAVAMMLFLMTFSLTIIGHIIRIRFREEYQ
ncbi:Phosphate ABC transporter membrane protein 1 (PhoT family) [Planctomycetales bacterium 10988]|nr:Phosphate ABC transporter membrane protein 1 (PhoT family) [Planctomycetales bacterium 10988]